MELQKFKKQFEKTFSKYLKKKINKGTDILGHKELNSYIEYLYAFVFSGGKRIRPYCCYMSYLGSGGKNKKDIMKFSMCFEMMHTMALIHDDIIDNAKKRHNVETVHQFISENLNEKIGKDEGLLIGDIVLSRVYEILGLPYTFKEKHLIKAKECVHNMIEEVILGQMIDVYLTTGVTVKESLLEKKNMYKTASYTFTRPLLTGAILAGANKEKLEHIKVFGDAIGIAFQIRDDLKDILATETDKKIFSDIQEGQQTFFTQYIEKHGTKKQKDLLKNMMRKKVNKQEIKLLQEMFMNSGAIAAGKEYIKKYGKSAERALKKIHWKKEEEKYFLDITRKITNLDI